MVEVWPFNTVDYILYIFLRFQIIMIESAAPLANLKSSSTSKLYILSECSLNVFTI